MSTARGGELRVILDTNVLISAFTQPHGRVAPVWQAARERRYRLVVSPPLIAEAAGVLRVKFAWEQGRVIRRLKLLTRIGELVVPRITVEVITEDPPDNRILECAVEGRADLIVSGNRHLLRLKTYQGIAVVRPIDFLRTLGIATPKQQSR